MRLSLTLLLPLLLATASLVRAAEELHLVKPSRVSAAKKKEREPLFTPWMTFEELNGLVNTKRDEQLIYFEADNEKELLRAIFTKDLKKTPAGYTHKLAHDNVDIQINARLQIGSHPVFVILDRAGNCRILYMQEDAVAAAQKYLEEKLGVEAPVLEKKKKR
ncbi:MAG TPA: hypothetical protein VD994_10205 [Prosthecobacter sp.]|nr:hypothetical protein [Prosthecobacter sp.]